MIEITFLDNNQFLVKCAKNYDFNKYINIIMSKLFYCASFNKNGGGWIFPYTKLSEVQTAFHNKVYYNNEYIPPPYFNLGKNMLLQPYDYQKEAIHFAINNFESLLVLPCGSGKSPIMIGAYLECKENNIIDGKGLIVVKASLKPQWVKEVSKFSNFTAKAITTYSDLCSYNVSKINKLNKELKKTKPTDIKERERLLKLIDEAQDKANIKFDNQFDDSDIYIVNYETLLDNKVKEKLLSMNINFVAADEIHYCKSKTAARSKALYEFNKAKIKIGATATPVTKDPRDLYGIYKFIKEELLGPYNKFERNHVKYAGWGRINGFKNMDQLKEKISLNIFVKTKKEVSSQLPSLSVIPERIDLTTEHEERFNEILEELDVLNNQDYEIRRRCKSPQEALLNEELQQIQAKIMALQTFAQEITDSNELLLSSESDMSKRYALKTNKNPKLEICMELVQQIIESGEKVIIFSKFERMQGILTKAIKSIDKNIEVAYVNGSLSSEQRYHEVYEKFKENNNCKVLLCSDAGAEGLNAGFCRYLIEYELATSYAIQTQRHGRLERADSKFNSVIVYQLIANNSWDEIQEKIVNKKEGFDTEIIKSLA